jgi:hypothetical protein
MKYNIISDIVSHMLLVSIYQRNKLIFLLIVWGKKKTRIISFHTTVKYGDTVVAHKLIFCPNCTCK